MKFDDLTSSFEPAPEGPATGILTGFIDRGEQTGKFGPRRQAVLQWLLPDVETENGEPCRVFQTIWNLSMRSKAFREAVSGLMGAEPLAGRSLGELVGRAARLTIVHHESETQVYANIASIRALPRGTKAPETDQKLIYFSLDPDEFSEAELNSLPDREQERIRSSETYRQTKAVLAARAKPTAKLIDDDLPDLTQKEPAKPRRKPAAKGQKPSPDDGLSFDAA
jgi:hypothetical protein